MSKKKAPSAAPSRTTPTSPPQIFEATFGANGSIVKRQAITQMQAEGLRKSGKDVVVCGQDLSANRSLARTIEVNANGTRSVVRRTKMQGPRACRTISRIRDLLTGTPSMKLRIEKRREHAMEFFTPELYLQFNSPDQETAYRADQTWENAIQDYNRHLDTFRDAMPSGVKELAEKLCLHDAEFIAFQENVYKPRHAFYSPVTPVAILAQTSGRARCVGLCFMGQDSPFAPTKRVAVFRSTTALALRRDRFGQELSPTILASDSIERRQSD